MANVFRVQIENNLDEWVTGEHISIAFSQTAWTKVSHAPQAFEGFWREDEGL